MADKTLPISPLSSEMSKEGGSEGVADLVESLVINQIQIEHFLFRKEVRKQKPRSDVLLIYKWK